MRTAAGQPGDKPVRVTINGREAGAFAETCREAVWHDCDDVDIATMPAEVELAIEGQAPSNMLY